MRREEWALLVSEVRRRVVSYKYGVVLFVMTSFIWSTVNQMKAFEASTGVGYNAWDVFIGLFGNTYSALTSTVVFTLLFIFLLGSSVQEDVASGYSVLVQSRLSRKNSYWWIKMLVVPIVVGTTVAALLAISLVMGATRGLPVLPATLSEAGVHPDAWGIAPAGTPPIYYSLPSGTSVVLHGLLIALYFSFAYTSVTVFTIGTAARSRSSYTPLASGVLFMGLNLAAATAAPDSIYSVTLISALTESSHRPIPLMDSPVYYSVPWSHSLLLLLALLIIGLLIGYAITPTRRASLRGARLPRAVALVLIAVLAMPAAGCVELPEGVTYEQFIGAAYPQVPDVRLEGLTQADIDYVRTVARQTVRLRDAVADLNAVWGSQNLHASEVEVNRMLSDRLDTLDELIRETRAIEVPPTLEDWFALQYGPGLDELQYVVDNLQSLHERHDHVGIKMCLKHVWYADTYFSAAAESVTGFMPSE